MTLESWEVKPWVWHQRLWQLVREINLVVRLTSDESGDAFERTQEKARQPCTVSEVGKGRMRQTISLALLDRWVVIYEAAAHPFADDDIMQIHSLPQLRSLLA